MHPCCICCKLFSRFGWKVDRISNTIRQSLPERRVIMNADDILKMSKEDLLNLNVKAKEPNADCWDCLRCSDCSDCLRCSDCLDCSGCSGCSDCSGCHHCLRCFGCSDCSGCHHCLRCFGCSDCSGCTDCSGCSGCSGCSDCLDCSGCSNCLNCLDCLDCYKCEHQISKRFMVANIQLTENQYKQVMEILKG